MADPYHHSLSSVKKWGGEVDDYLPAHRWFDQPKGHFSDPRSRAIRHHAQGIDWAIEHFGQTITLSTCKSCGDTLEDHGPQRGHVFVAKKIPTRWVGEQHVIEDFGRIPTMADFLRCMTVEPWMVRSAIPLSRVL
jgi:hypothetical protein